MAPGHGLGEGAWVGQALSPGQGLGVGAGAEASVFPIEWGRSSGPPRSWILSWIIQSVPQGEPPSPGAPAVWGTRHFWGPLEMALGLSRLHRRPRRAKVYTKIPSGRCQAKLEAGCDQRVSTCTCRHPSFPLLLSALGFSVTEEE